MDEPTRERRTEAERTQAARAQLTAERARLRGELRDTHVEAPGMMTYGSQAAAASQVFEQQRDLALREHNEGQVSAIEAALARIDAGTWGLCTSCRKPINPERLDALPSAALCIDCQRLAGAARRR